MVFRRKNQAQPPLEEKNHSLRRKDYPSAYLEWQRLVTKKMPHLSKPQAVVLAMWSFGIAVTHCCGISTVTVFIAELLGQKQNNIRERLRQWYKEKPPREARKLSNLDVRASFVPLLKWILSWWSSSAKNLVLAADASTLGERFTVLLISVVVKGCGIPVAWKIVGATEKGSWKPYWLELFELIQPGIPDDWKVIVTTDRGLYAKWMYQAIEQCQWHPFMRINQQGLYQSDSPAATDGEWMPLSKLIAQVGEHFVGRVTCFKSHSLSCTLLAQWDEGYSDPWLIVTNLPPSEANICWYGMRSWIECLFKDLKRGGFGWHHTKMTDPKRAERLWLAIAVATLWYVSLGGGFDGSLSASSLSTNEFNSNISHANLSAHEGQNVNHANLSAYEGQNVNHANLSAHEWQFDSFSSLTTDINPTAENASSQLNNSSDLDNCVPHLPQPVATPGKNLTSRCLSCFRLGFVRLLAALIRQAPLPTRSLITDYSLIAG